MELLMYKINFPVLPYMKDSQIISTYLLIDLIYLTKPCFLCLIPVELYHLTLW